VKDETFDFHGSTFTIKILTAESNDQYMILDTIHPPNVGPALHTHPRGPETFCVIEGNYEFILNDKSILAKAGDVVCVLTGSPHRFVTGENGGHVIVSSPPNLEFYFWEVSKLLGKGSVSHEQESDIGRKYGQIFLEDVKHWI
jgi:quercetin dioxygenase-like cupin family protein